MANRIKGITVEIGGDTTKLQNALKEVNTEIRTTQSALKDVEKLLKLDPGNTELLEQKQRKLGEAVSSTKEKLATLKTAADQANDALAKGDMSQDQYDALQREIAETEQNLKSLEQEYKNFGSVQAQEVAQAGEKMKELGDGMASVGTGLTASVTAPLTAIGAAGAASFAEVDKTMSLTNKTMGNTAEEAEILNRAMKEAASNSTYGMSDAANATLNFARAGLDAEQAAAALSPAMNLAAGEGGNLDTVSGGLVATINGFHGSFDEAGRYADVFAAACNNSALDVNSLSGAMSVAAPIFSSAGYSVEDAALYMGVMANNGIEAGVAANSLKTGLAKMISPSKEGADMMEKLGISITNTDGSMKDSVTIQKELHEAFSRLSESEQIAAASAIFGKNQMAPWLALIGTAPADVAALDGSLRGCAGTTEEMAEAMMGGFGGSIEKLKSSIDVLVYSIGEALAPTILKVIEGIQGLVDKFNALSPAQQQLIVTIGMLVAAVGPVLVIVGKLMSTVGTIMTMAPKIQGAITAVHGALSAGPGILSGLGAAIGGISAPILAIVAVVGVLIAAFVALWNNNEAFREAVISIWQNIVSAVTGFLDGLKDLIFNFGEHFSSLVEKMGAVWESIVSTVSTAASTVGETLSTAWQGISEKTSSVWEGIKGKISETMQGVQENLSTAWQGITETLGPLLEALRYLFETVFEACRILIGRAMEDIAGDVKAGWENIVAFLSPILDHVKSIVENAWNNVKGVVEGVLKNIQTVTKSAWEAVKGVVDNVLGGIRSSVSGAFSSVQNAFSSGWNNVKSVTSNALSSIRNAVVQVFNNVIQAVGNSMRNVLTVVQQGFTNVGTYFKNVATQAYNWGMDIIRGIINGITSSISALTSTITNVANTIRSFLHFSVPDKGPLTDYESWMPDFMGGLAKGIEKSRGLVQTAMADVAGDMTLSPAAASRALSAEASGQGGSGNGALVSLLSQYLPYLPQLANMTVVTETGALVGQLAPQMNQKLGEMARRERRQ